MEILAAMEKFSMRQLCVFPQKQRQQSAFRLQVQDKVQKRQFKSSVPEHFFDFLTFSQVSTLKTLNTRPMILSPCYSILNNSGLEPQHFDAAAAQGRKK
jgi:hypothetical protein